MNLRVKENIVKEEANLIMQGTAGNAKLNEKIAQMYRLYTFNRKLLCEVRYFDMSFRIYRFLSVI